MPDFNTMLKFGKETENRVATYLQQKQSCSLLPVCNIKSHQFKGPHIIGADLIAPDFIVFGSLNMISKNNHIWIEVKGKFGFSWYRKNSAWQTGVDNSAFSSYCKVADETGIPVGLLFLGYGEQSKDAPVGSPSGLYGGSIDYLQDNIDHYFSDYGNGGMVFWNVNDLVKIAELSELCN